MKAWHIKNFWWQLPFEVISHQISVRLKETKVILLIISSRVWENSLFLYVFEHHANWFTFIWCDIYIAIRNLYTATTYISTFNYGGISILPSPYSYLYLAWFAKGVYVRVWLTVLCSKLLNSNKSRLFTQRVPKFQLSHKRTKWIGLQSIEVDPFCNECGDRTRQIIPTYSTALTNKISATDICRLQTISKKNLDQINYDP